jgi:hypothetical protein
MIAWDPAEGAPYRFWPASSPDAPATGWPTMVNALAEPWYKLEMTATEVLYGLLATRARTDSTQTPPGHDLAEWYRF